ncbi:MAG: deoxyribose-phosphate aldolase [Planctomycetaceae bacterium]|nr:deoxyribose-phosphate aldolase [Planctomycetaceae bacterium]
MIDLSQYDKRSIGKLFDFSILPKNTTEREIREGCREAIRYNCAAFYSATPYWTPVVVEELKGSNVHIATGIDFPFGASPSIIKAFETEKAVALGCTSVDLTMNIGALKSGHIDVVRGELADYVKAAGDALTKVILEVCYLTDDEIVTACNLVAESGAQYAKTSSGQFEGPDMSQFLLMKETLKGTGLKLKVSGAKFPRPQNAYTFILAGADLIGTRAAPEIIDALDQMRTIGLVPPYQGE